MSDGEKIVDLQRELLESEEYRRIAKIHQFSLSLEIFRKNAAELRHPLELMKDWSFTTRLGATRNRYLSELFLRDITRRLHNFVVAAKSLVYHSRNFYDKDYASKPEFHDYEGEKKTRFTDDPVIQFIQGLRNYAVHVRIPNVSSKVSITIGKGEFRHILYLDRDEIINFDGWNSAAKKFLKESNREIDLYKVVVDYEAKINDFYNWVYERLRQVHSNDMRVVAAKQEGIRRVLAKHLPYQLESGLKQLANTKIPPEDIFTEHVDPEIFYKITSPGESPIERAAALLDYVSKYATISEDLRQRVLHAFKDFYGIKNTGA